MKIKYKMIFLLSAVTMIAIFPLAVMVLMNNEKVITEKTLDVSRNLSQNIAKASAEELLIDASYDNTHSVMAGLKESRIEGLLDALVINVNGTVVSGLEKNYKVGTFIDKNQLRYILSLETMKLDETVASYSIIRISYPIFIRYNNENIHVGGAIFEFDRKLIYRPVDSIRNSIIFLTLVVFAAALLLAIIAAVYLTRPLHALAEGAEIIGQGKLSHRITVSSSDEIGRLARSFNNMTARIQDFTANLEYRVQERTKELNQSLEKIQALKEQQDGDYYLTSILTKPLRANNNTIPHVTVKYIIEQKKKFKYKNWSSEIGGDICMADSIALGSRKFTVILNADAMGKSIQGAGGALVLGAAFRARLLQTRNGKSGTRDPEVWLRDSYNSLQDIFISFDGSMYATMVLGLVDEQNGKFYFINVEHPHPVLVRDRVAEFLEEVVVLPKLGSAGAGRKFAINTFQIRTNDIILCGSDGKDDIVLSKGKTTHEEEINEDPELFLRMAEKTEGDLDRLMQEIQSRGEPLDDISILSIQFSGNTAKRQKKAK